MFELINDNCFNCFRKIIEQNKNKKIIIVTDPPFNINYHYNQYKDNLKEDEYYNKLKYLFNDIPSVVIHYPESMHKLSIKLGKAPDKVVSWVYNSNTGKQHRDIAFYNIKPDMSKVRQPYKNLNDKRIQERISKGCKGAKLYDWWNINQVKNVSKEKLNHPCQMPIEVMKNIIGILPNNCLIIDPFMGTNTTGLAVKIMNEIQNVDRQFIGIELDEKYFNIAKERI